MDLVRIKYSGRKAFNDRASKTTWLPGDSKPVTIDTARRLNKFAEFSPDAVGVNEADEVQSAMARQTEVELEASQERNQVEHMLLTVESMDKGALEAYAGKYEVNIDKRKKVEDLRVQVSTLIEQFGAR